HVHDHQTGARAARHPHRVGEGALTGERPVEAHDHAVLECRVAGRDVPAVRPGAALRRPRTGEGLRSGFLALLLAPQPWVLRRVRRWGALAGVWKLVTGHGYERFGETGSGSGKERPSSHVQGTAAGRPRPDAKRTEPMVFLLMGDASTTCGPTASGVHGSMHEAAPLRNGVRLLDAWARRRVPGGVRTAVGAGSRAAGDDAAIDHDSGICRMHVREI